MMRATPDGSQPNRSKEKLLYCFFLGAVLALRLVSEPTANVSYFVIAGYALVGRAQAIQALALSWLFTVLSPGIASEASAATVGRYAVLLGAATSIFLHRAARVRRRDSTLVAFTIFLGGAFVFHSVLFSPIVDVSVLKALSWTFAMATSAAAWHGLTNEKRDELSGQLFWGLVVLLAVSLPLAVTPLGYLRNGTGFQGVLNHPQALGPTMGLLGSWTIARLFGERRPSWWLVGVAVGCLAAVLMSEARTAGLAMLFGVGLSILIAPGVAGQSFGTMVPGLRSARVWTVIFVVLLTGLVMAPTISGLLQNYVTKSGRADVTGILEAYDESRGHLIDAMLENVADHPLVGIGFGIASDPALMTVQRDAILGLPTGASIEKGVAPLAVLEETGVFGAALVALWVVLLLRGSARSGLAPFAVCLTALALTMGEATLFSPGGIGLLPIVLFGWTNSSRKTTGAPRWLGRSGSGNVSFRRTWQG